MACKVLQDILSAEELPALPAVAIQVLRLTRQEDVPVGEIVQAIEQDPALTARILKVVNSSLFGLSHRIGTLRQAIVVLGLRAVKVMALSFSLVNKLGEEDLAPLDHETFWKRSLTTAVSSRLLADAFQPRVRDEAFVAGLLTDLGILAAVRYAPDHYRPVLDAYGQRNQPLQLLEAEVLGTTHAEIGGALLQRWQLPEAMSLAVRQHHDRTMPAHDDCESLSRIVWVAAQISDLFCSDAPPTELHTVTRMICQSLQADGNGAAHRSEQDIDNVLQQISGLVQEAAQQISINIGTTMSYEDLRAAAMAQLAQLSMRAELDCAAASRLADAARKQAESLASEKQALAQEARTDALTQVSNRKAFDDGISEAIAQCHAAGTAIGLIMYDLDHFKHLNDTYGHLFGDEVLKVVGGVLKRIGDAGEQVARYGGDEFAILCLKSTRQQLRSLAESIRQETERIALQYGTQTIQITASMGAAHFDPQQGEFSAKDVIEQADRCLLDAKQAGRNQVRMGPRLH